MTRETDKEEENELNTGCSAGDIQEPRTDPGEPLVSLEGIPDYDRDSLHTLSLSIMPLENESLRRSKLIKNTHLESVVELFHDKYAGSGQLYIEEVEKEFGSDSRDLEEDMKVLRALAALHSYDVFSLRVSLRELGIEVNGVKALQLSEQRRGELAEYMKEFTHPLIREIYGSKNDDIDKSEDVIQLFKDPDVVHARKKMRIMADKLSIDVMDLPKFLEDYGDIFLSLSYYQQCLDAINPIIDDLVDTIKEIEGHPQLKQNRNLMNNCHFINNSVSHLTGVLTSRFSEFEHSTGGMWENISAEKFREVEAMIESYHITIGGTLCSLSVKMDAWRENFPDRHTGGPARRADFLMTDILHGIENILAIENSAP